MNRSKGRFLKRFICMAGALLAAASFVVFGCALIGADSVLPDKPAQQDKADR